jgi:DNA ligase 1
MDFPVLYKKTSTGKIQEWKIYTVGNIIFTEWGQKDGKKQVSEEFINSGKNIGKSNETSPTEQAQLEAQAQWEKKCKKHYVDNINDAAAGIVDKSFVAGGLAPMLAHNFDKQGHKIEWPAFAQPKLDGHRCIAVIENGKCTLWSRSQKPITSMPHIVAEIESIMVSDIVFDGELYNHDYRDRFEDLTSLIRPPDPRPGKENVQYHVYDIIENWPQSKRFEFLNALQVTNPGWKYVKFVQTELVQDGGEMEEFFLDWEDKGYEGAILRNTDADYKSKRSYDLQKVKNFNDAEFEVVDIEQGRGKMEGKAIFVCKADNGETFNVKLMGALEDLEAYLDDKDHWIGKQLTVKYQGLTNYGIPRFPVGLRFRNEI